MTEPSRPSEDRVVAHGIDLVDVERIARMLEEHGDRCASRCFTAAERAYADASDRRRAERYAARFAAKEAVLKALGTGWRSGIAWTDMGIVNEPSGRPVMRLTGRCAEIAEERGIRRWDVSLSHAERYAVASALGLG